MDYVQSGKHTAVKLLLHTCCAPCSGAIIETLLKEGIRPVIYYFNPNIYPLDEYILRKNECSRYASECGLEMVDADYSHEGWLQCVAGLEKEPERGLRCTECFKHRLLASAQYAAANGFDTIATTLASSRWKNIDQVNAALRWAASQVEGVACWERNWRKGGLQERRNQIIRERNFYNQLYCGCEFSIAHISGGGSGCGEASEKSQEKTR